MGVTSREPCRGYRRAFQVVTLVVRRGLPLQLTYVLAPDSPSRLAPGWPITEGVDRPPYQQGSPFPAITAGTSRLRERIGARTGAAPGHLSQAHARRVACHHGSACGRRPLDHPAATLTREGGQAIRDSDNHNFLATPRLVFPKLVPGRRCQNRAETYRNVHKPEKNVPKRVQTCSEPSPTHVSARFC